MTFSIAGRCQRTGAFGAAISSSSPAVASRCLWMAAERGVVLTQNVTDPAIGPAGLALLDNGASASQVLAVLAGRAHFEWRQVAILDAHGQSDWHNGAQVLGVHHAVSGPDCVAAGNLLATPEVIDAMVATFVSHSELALPQRLLKALGEGNRMGGEAGPVHSAGLKVVTDLIWPVVDLRVDWDDEPIARLDELWQVYQPQMADYVLRAGEPGRAPSYGVPGDDR